MHLVSDFVVPVKKNKLGFYLQGYLWRDSVVLGRTVQVVTSKGIRRVKVLVVHQARILFDSCFFRQQTEPILPFKAVTRN